MPTIPQLKYYDSDTNRWSAIDTEGNTVRFTYGKYAGKTLIQVIKELESMAIESTASYDSIASNLIDSHVLNIEEDNQKEVILPVKIDPLNNSFLLFLNQDILSTNSYVLNDTGDSILLNKNLHTGDVLYIVIFKTIRIAPPENYDGILISEGSVQESKLSPTVQKKINEAISINEKGVSLATLADGKVPIEQLPNPIIISETEPVNPNENDIWIVI